MELKQLTYFLSVAEHLSFSRAAEALFISQPALSYQISTLEKELNTKLFIRNSRNVHITPAGGALIPLARATLQSVENISVAAQNGFPATESPKKLSVALDCTEDNFESTGVTKMLALFNMKYPEIPLELTQMEFDDSIQRLLDDTLDVSCLILRHSESLPSQLVYKTIRSDTLKFVCKKDESIHDYRDLCRKHKIILAKNRSRSEMYLAKALSELSVTPSYLRVDSIPASFTYMQAERGAIFLPKNYIDQRHYPDLMFIDIPSPYVTIKHVVAWNRFNQNPSIQMLVNILDPHDALDAGESI
jgi:DNA-binding transcriptional LysR family regulator